MADGLTCPGCGTPLDVETAEWPPACESCRREYPAALLKAAVDNFFYALRLVTGEIVEFESCEIHGRWIHLLPPGGYDDHGRGFLEGYDEPQAGLPYPAPRGLDIRLDHIVWCADAPKGS